MPTKEKDKEKKSSSSRSKKSSSRDKDKTDKDKEKKSSSSSSSKKKKSSSSSSRPSSSRKKSGESAPKSSTGDATLPQKEPKVPSSDFEAGLLFERYANGGGGRLDAQDFQKMWRERKSGGGGTTAAGAAAGVGAAASSPRRLSASEAGGNPFDMGQLFERYSSTKDGMLSQADFERLMKEKQADERQQQDGGGQRGLGPAPLDPLEAVDAYNYGGVRVGPPLTHYNETTGVPVPREAAGAQQSLGHTVVPLGDAYDRRMSRLEALVSSRLLPAREGLLQLRRRLHSTAEEVKMAVSAIERETMADTNAILERLRSAESLKQASLQQRVGDVTAELLIIDGIAERVACVAVGGAADKGGGGRQGYGAGSLGSGAPAAAAAGEPGYVAPASRYRHEFDGAGRMVDLIQSYADLCTSIEKIADKPLDASIDVTPDDFPREMAERLEVLRRADRYEKVLAVKDQVVWGMLEESKKLQERCRVEAGLGQDYAAETAEWVELTHRLRAELLAANEQAAAVPALKGEIMRLYEENRSLQIAAQATRAG